jgi:hypothetical protein
MQDWTLDEFNDSEKIMGLKIGEVIDVTDSSPTILKAMQDWTLNEFNDPDKIMSLQIGQVVDVTNDSPKILRTMQEWTLEQFNSADAVNGLLLGDVIDIDDEDEDTPQILKSMANFKIGSLGDSISELTLVDILGEENVKNNFVFCHVQGSTLDTLASNIEQLTIQQIFWQDVYSNNNAANEEDLIFYDAAGKALVRNADDEKFYYVDSGEVGTPALTGSWKYLLTDKDTGEEKPCLLSETGKLVENMSYNISNATLYDLEADGILQFDDGFLDTALVSTKPAYAGKKMGDLTIQGLTQYVASLTSTAY